MHDRVPGDYNDLERGLIPGANLGTRTNHITDFIRDRASRFWPATKAYTASAFVNLYKFYCFLEFGSKAMLPHLTSALLFGFIVQMLYLVGIFSYFGAKFRENENDTLCDQKYNDTITGEIIKRQVPCTDLDYSSAEILDMDIYTALWLTMQQIFFGGLSNLYLAIRYSYAPIIIAYFARVQYERYFHIQPEYYINHRVRALMNVQTLKNYLDKRPNQDFSRKIPEGFAYYFQALAMIVGLSFIVGDIALLKSAKIYVDKFEETEEETSENSPLAPQDQNTANASREAFTYMLQTIAHFLDPKNPTFKGMLIGTTVLVGFLLVVPPILKALLIWSGAKEKNDLSKYRSEIKEYWTEVMNSDTKLHDGLRDARNAGAVNAVVHDNIVVSDSQQLHILTNSDLSTWVVPSNHPYPSLRRLCDNLPDHKDYTINFYNTTGQLVGNYTKAHGFVHARQQLVAAPPVTPHNEAAPLLDNNIDEAIRRAYTQGIRLNAATVSVIPAEGGEALLVRSFINNGQTITLQEFTQAVNHARREQDRFIISFYSRDNHPLANHPIPMPANQQIDFDWMRTRLDTAITDELGRVNTINARVMFITNDGYGLQELNDGQIPITQANQNEVLATIMNIAQTHAHPLRVIVSFTHQGNEVGCFHFSAKYVPHNRQAVLQNGLFGQRNDAAAYAYDHNRYTRLYQALMNANNQITHFTATQYSRQGQANIRTVMVNTLTTESFADFVISTQANGSTAIHAYSGGVNAQQLAYTMQNPKSYTFKQSGYFPGGANPSVTAPEQAPTALVV